MKSYIHFQSMESLIRGGWSEQAREGASVLLLPIRLWGLLKGLSTGFMGCSFTLRTRWIIAIYYISGHCWLPGSGCVWGKRVSFGFCPPKFSHFGWKGSVSCSLPIHSQEAEPLGNSSSKQHSPSWVRWLGVISLMIATSTWSGAPRNGLLFWVLGLKEHSMPSIKADLTF